MPITNMNPFDGPNLQVRFDEARHNLMNKVTHNRTQKRQHLGERKWRLEAEEKYFIRTGQFSRPFKPPSTDVPPDRELTPEVLQLWDELECPFQGQKLRIPDSIPCMEVFLLESGLYKVHHFDILCSCYFVQISTAGTTTSKKHDIIASAMEYYLLSQHPPNRNFTIEEVQYIMVNTAAQMKMDMNHLCSGSSQEEHYWARAKGINFGAMRDALLEGDGIFQVLSEREDARKMHLNIEKHGRWKEFAMVRLEQEMKEEDMKQQNGLEEVFGRMNFG